MNVKLVITIVHISVKTLLAHTHAHVEKDTLSLIMELV